jgi:hypothetical protein
MRKEQVLMSRKKIKCDIPLFVAGSGLGKASTAPSEANMPSTRK